MPKHRRLKDERGQASIFMALFVSTMIMLFAFTTNIGMLVHAKINLQNAADAAAYAGAATQARQLTSAAYINWEMRRALKEFMYYYTVRSQYVAMPCFPLDATGRTLPICQARFGPTGADERYKFGFNDPRPGELNVEAGGPYLPTTCIIFSAENNYCQKGGVPGIPEFPSGGAWGVADPIVAAVRSATDDIITKKLNDCTGRTAINQQYLLNWLFNLFPQSFTLQTGLDAGDPFVVTEGLDRLGVLPRMALLRARLNNFEEELNMNLGREGISVVTTATMDTFRANKTATKSLDYYERPIQAFLSAKNNLPTIEDDNGNFTDIELTELLPTSASAEVNPLLQNPPALVKFTDLYAKITVADSKFDTVANLAGAVLNRGNCIQSREERVIPRFPFGVSKDPTVPTYYAVRLQAKARLLFSPFNGNGIVTLSAYSAAKPFGSRVGKNLDPDGSQDGALKMEVSAAALGSVVVGGVQVADTTPIESSFAPAFPNVLVSDGDTVSSGTTAQGFTTMGHLGYLRAAAVTTGRADYGQRLAGAYAPWEIGFFTPPASYPSSGEIIGLFEDNPFQGADPRFFSLLAPVYQVNGSGGASLDFISTMIKGYLVGTALDAQTLESLMGYLNSSILSEDKFANLYAYLVGSGQVYYQNIRDPMLGDEPALQAYARSVGQRYTVAGMQNAYKRQLTSWNNEKTSADSSLGIEPASELGPDMGRSGYSVKFISFAALKKGGQATNDADQAGLTWANPLARFNGGATQTARILDDINKVQH